MKQPEHFGDTDPTPHNWELHLALSTLRSKFENEVLEVQKTSPRFKMFTLVEQSQTGLDHVFVRFRLVDGDITDIREALSEGASIIDVALAVSSDMDTDNPVLLMGEPDADTFLWFSGVGETEHYTVVDQGNIIDFMNQEPEFLPRSTYYKPSALRQSAA